MRRLAFLIPLLAVLCAFAHPCEAAPTPDKRALMRLAHPGWNGLDPWLMQVPSEDTPFEPTWIAATPTRVVRLDATHVVLLVTGTPTDEAGHDTASHPSSGHLGAVWFERAHGRWRVSHRRDALLWAGSWGDLGTVAPFDLGGGHRAVSVRSGGCWMNGCTSMLDIVELGIDRASLPFPSTRVASDLLEGNERCGPALHAPRGARRAISDELDEHDCFEIAATWRLAARGGASRADIVLAFGGREIVRAEGTKTLSVKTLTERLVFRYEGGRYVLVRGRNPTRDI